MSEGNLLSQPVESMAPVSATLRKRLTLELAALTVLTPLFLYFAPHNIGLYATMAVLFFGIIAVNARKRKERIWPRPTLEWRERLHRSTAVMLAVTMPTVFVFYAWCVWTGHHVSYVNLLLAFCLYFPWALLQQSIFMVYLLGRLRIVFPWASSLVLAGLNGTAYGLVHLPDKTLALVTVAAGIVWSYAYLRDRQLLPIVMSHALLGSTFYYFVGARDLYQDWLTVVGKIF
jgi:membrane protease YdiL (CAAX protease family)